MNSNTTNGWSLEVVRGKDVGRRYALLTGETILGNDVQNQPGINLAEQEGNAPRRMAGQQAAIALQNGSATLRDLDSPGGTFVNRQRVLSGQSRALQDGDVIQVGGVQLRVVASSAKPRPRPATPAPKPAPPPPKPTPGAFAFTMKGGTVCRSWDDFLTVSAQRWADVREELTSGRLAAFLNANGRSEFAPNPDAPGTPDERLDAWLAGLPTTKEARPELDVYPDRIAVQAAAGGGMTRRVVRISNIGYRLLSCEVRVEPEGTDWLAIPAAFAGRPFVTIEGTDLPLEIRIPETDRGPLSATLVIQSNGGNHRVPVTLGPPVAHDEIPAAATAAGTARPELGLRSWVERQSARRRLIVWPLALLVGRLLISLLGRIPGTTPDVSGNVPGLGGPALFLAILGALAGIVLAKRRGGWADIPSGGLAGAIVGLLVSAVMVAACRAVEPDLGSSPPHAFLTMPLLWGAIGAALAGLSLGLVPSRNGKEATS